MAIIYYNNDTEINLTDLINIVDDLTSSSSTSALSANQGRALNTIIGNLSSLTTTDKSSIVNAINDVVHKTDLLGSEPVGSILPYCGNEAPPGYYVCDGRAISRENNADLFNVIGTTYGSGDGSTTFNLPDLRDKFILGKGENTNVADIGDNMNIIVETEDILTYVVMLFVIKAEGTEPATMAESLPVGSVVDFDGEVNRIPTGWVVTENDSPQAIFCTLKADTSITQNYTALTNWQVRNTVGTELSVGTNGIVIGKNIHNVEVLCKSWVSLDPSGLYYTFICVNGDNISYTWQIHYVVSNQAQSVFNQAIIPVQEGDYVSFKTYGSGSVGSNTSIIVKKIN